MSRKFDKRSTMVLAIAVLALVVGATSTAAYAVTVARNSVVSSSIKNGEVKSKDIGAGAVDARRLGEIKVVRATSAATGDADGVTNGGGVGTVVATVQCPKGARVISGGADWVNGSSDTVDDLNLYLHSSYPTGRGWSARGSIDIGAQGTVKLRVRALCLVS